MSFRLRIFLLVMLTAVTAIGATAWLTLSLTSREVARAAQASETHRQEIVAAVNQFGLTHGAWPGLDVLAAGLSRRTRLHIQLATIGGEILVDTDNLQGWRAGPVDPIPALVDPRPAIAPEVTEVITRSRSTAAAQIRGPSGKPVAAAAYPNVPKDLFGAEPTDPRFRSAEALMLRQLAQYRAALATVRCIARADPSAQAVLPMTVAPYLTPALLADHAGCVRQGADKVLVAEQPLLRDHWKRFTGCVDPRTLDAAPDCMFEVFLEASDTTAGGTTAVPLKLYLGAPAETDVGQLGRPAAFGIAGLLVVALVGTALIARRVSHPVRRLTEASRLLATGRHEVRVPSAGRGELARLSASFNAMAEAVQRSEERQRRLVADVAHEMRTPLSNLRGYLEGLSDGVVEPSRELFASLHEETLLQRRILDDLQVLADAEAGGLDYDRRSIDLAELAGTAATAHLAVAAAAGVTLTAEVPAPVWVQADADRLRQVLGNLVTNAVRYTDTGGQVLVGVRAEAGEAVLTVRDTGVGIAPDDLRRVFDRFWRADPARQRATGGSGLGLTIAQRIVADHAGRIDVTSEPGIGSTFSVRLPLT